MDDLDSDSSGRCRLLEKREITKENNKQTIIYQSDNLVSAEDGKGVNTPSHSLFS